MENGAPVIGLNDSEEREFRMALKVLEVMQIFFIEIREQVE